MQPRRGIFREGGAGAAITTFFILVDFLSDRLRFAGRTTAGFLLGAGDFYTTAKAGLVGIANSRTSFDYFTGGRDFARRE